MDRTPNKHIISCVFVVFFTLTTACSEDLDTSGEPLQNDASQHSVEALGSLHFRLPADSSNYTTGAGAPHRPTQQQALCELSAAGGTVALVEIERLIEHSNAQRDCSDPYGYSSSSYELRVLGVIDGDELPSPMSAVYLGPGGYDFYATLGSRWIAAFRPSRGEWFLTRPYELAPPEASGEPIPLPTSFEELQLELRATRAAQSERCGAVPPDDQAWERRSFDPAWWGRTCQEAPPAPEGNPNDIPTPETCTDTNPCE